MSVKRMILFLGCVAPVALLATGSSSAETLRRPSLLQGQASGAAQETPFNLRAALPADPTTTQGIPRSPLLSGTGSLTNAQPQPRAPANINVAPAKVDESALRFYASQNDAARVSMEIRRLKALHPTWEPPSNLFEEARDPTIEQGLWDLFAAGRFDEIRTAVAEIRAQDPTWRPSDDFITKFERAELRVQLVAASDAKDAAGVLTLAEFDPGMLACSDIDVMWRVAEALIQTGDQARAQELYRYILSNCADPAARLATVQKASELLPPEIVKTLIAMGRRQPGGMSEFEAVQLDLLRRQIGSSISDPTSQPVPVAELRKFEALVTQKKFANDAVLLGWLRYSQKDWPGAAQWFKQAMSWERVPKAAEGYALALRQQGQLQEAEELAYEWRDADPLIAKLYVEIVAMALTEPNPGTVEAGRLSRTAGVVETVKSAMGAQALGWYYYNTSAYQEAQSWFSKAVAWEANETNALGLALAAHQVKDQALFRKTIAQYGERFPAVAALEAYNQKVAAKTARRGTRRGGGQGGGRAGQMAREAVAQFKDGKYREALATLEQRAAIAREDHGLSVLRGWSLYHLSQYDKARTLFAELDKKRSTRDTQYGLYYSSSKLDPTHLGD
ncbi:hypothetical protein [Microvirga roseola]|uniref:hypothetical protein n=1 Tax=Microvirga roseola TaxID=2883126 RepID=UPI001E5DD574|nr:hypothetical protein [Microvirga roseola]